MSYLLISWELLYPVFVWFPSCKYACYTINRRVRILTNTISFRRERRERERERRECISLRGRMRHNDDWPGPVIITPHHREEREKARDERKINPNDHCQNDELEGKRNPRGSLDIYDRRYSPAIIVSLLLPLIAEDIFFIYLP